MSDQTPLQALASAAEHASVMAERLHKAVRLLAEQTTTCVAPATADPSERFTHTDDYGDTVVFKTDRPGQFLIETTEDSEVVLDQDAVNRLAQYLDQHRTDLNVMTDATGTEVIRESVGPSADEGRCPWAFLYGKREGKPYESYVRCQYVEGHGDSTHSSGNSRFLSGNPQAFRVDQSKRPNPEPVTDNNDLSEPCAGHSLDGPPDARGCGHRKDSHNVSGCVFGDCPCERRYGQ